jgi:hypothetical protein
MSTNTSDLGRIQSIAEKFETGPSPFYYQLRIDSSPTTKEEAEAAIKFWTGAGWKFLEHIHYPGAAPIFESRDNSGNPHSFIEMFLYKFCPSTEAVETFKKWKEVCNAVHA